MMVYFCGMKLVNCITSEVYNTQVTIKIKRKYDKQPRLKEAKHSILSSLISRFKTIISTRYATKTSQDQFLS